eukprot:6492684-Amphidinium_carterae.1
MQKFQFSPAMPSWYEGVWLCDVPFALIPKPLESRQLHAFLVVLRQVARSTCVTHACIHTGEYCHKLTACKLGSRHKQCVEVSDTSTMKGTITQDSNTFLSARLVA